MPTRDIWMLPPTVMINHLRAARSAPSALLGELCASASREGLQPLLLSGALTTVAAGTTTVDDALSSGAPQQIPDNLHERDGDTDP